MNLNQIYTRRGLGFGFVGYGVRERSGQLVMPKASSDFTCFTVLCAQQMLFVQLQ